jgi:hypothetical protein
MDLDGLRGGGELCGLTGRGSSTEAEFRVRPKNAPSLFRKFCHSRPPSSLNSEVSSHLEHSSLSINFHQDGPFMILSNREYFHLQVLHCFLS